MGNLIPFAQPSIHFRRSSCPPPKIGPRRKRASTSRSSKRPSPVYITLSPLQQSEFTKQELQLVLTYLPDFCVTHPSTQEELNVILNHWEGILEWHRQHQPKITKVEDLTWFTAQFDVFYDFLFQKAPHLKPLFHGPMQFKGRALMNVVGGIRSLLQSGDMVERAARIALRHVEYGVRSEHFNPLGVALMQTLHSLSPILWTSGVELAWRVVYCHVTVLMLGQMQQTIQQTRSNVENQPKPASPASHRLSRIRTGSKVLTEFATSEFQKLQTRGLTRATRRQSATSEQLPGPMIQSWVCPREPSPPDQEWEPTACTSCEVVAYERGTTESGISVVTVSTVKKTETNDEEPIHTFVSFDHPNDTMNRRSSSPDPIRHFPSRTTRYSITMDLTTPTTK